MFHTTKSCAILCSILALGAVVTATISTANSGAAKASSRSADAAATSLDDILHYISAGWDTLTRRMDQCQILEDTKGAGEAVLYLPAGMAIPASIATLQNHCRVRVEHLPKKITGPGQVDPDTLPAEG